jgi:hypothetical protein
MPLVEYSDSVRHRPCELIDSLALRAGMEPPKLARRLAGAVAAFSATCRDAGVPAIVPKPRGNP